MYPHTLKKVSSSVAVYVTSYKGFSFVAFFYIPTCNSIGSNFNRLFKVICYKRLSLYRSAYPIFLKLLGLL